MDSPEQKQPLRIIDSMTPIRICGSGGWTDTWFSGHGPILNIVGYPHAEEQIEVYAFGGHEDWIIFHAEDYAIVSAM